MLKQLVLILCLLTVGVAYAKNQTAIFAGGCFWCMEADFDKLDGVVSTISGYDGGKIKNPTYAKVSSGKTQYAEAVKVIYDTDKINYQQLLNYFWRNIDPTVKDRQFCDVGRQYRSAIFYLNNHQKQLALKSLQQIKQHFKRVYTEITPSTHFYPAETYHQNYYRKNPTRYRYYRWHCGRDARLKVIRKQLAQVMPR